MNERSRVARSSPGTMPLAALAAAAVLSVVIAACGSGSPRATTASDPAVNFARCMRAHGVSNFPDDLDVRGVPGVNPSSPVFEGAQTACQKLLPVKTPPAAAPSAQTHARLVRLASCLRAHGYPTMPDPRPNPPPQPGSVEANAYGTLYGEGGYWIGIPRTIDAHGASFVHTAIRCGATGVR